MRVRGVGEIHEVVRRGDHDAAPGLGQAPGLGHVHRRERVDLVAAPPRRGQYRGNTERLVTIELDRQHRVIQVRGFANRTARPEERKLLQRWAKARGIDLP
jgi:hypothetical protein